MKEKDIKERNNILKQLKMKKGKELISNDLRIAKEQCTDKVRYKKVKLDKYIKNRKRQGDNIKTHRDQKLFFKTLEGHQTRGEIMTEIKKLLNVLVGFGNKLKEHQICNERRGSQDCLLRSSVVNEFDIDTEKLKKEINKRKNWNDPKSPVEYIQEDRIDSGRRLLPGG